MLPDDGSSCAPRYHEAGRLQLATDKAHAMLGWAPAWGFAEGVAATVSWYRGAHEDPAPGNIAAMTRAQIRDYVDAAREASLAWAARSAA